MSELFVKIDELNQLAWELGNEEPDHAILLAEKARMLAREQGYQKGLAISLSQLGQFYYAKENYESALYYSLDSLEILEQLQDDERMLIPLGIIGATHRLFGNLSDSLTYHLRQLKISVELGNLVYQAKAEIGIGIIYEEKENYPQALKHYLHALEIYQEQGNPLNYAVVLFNLGTIYRKLGRLEEALSYATQLLQIGVEFDHLRWQSHGRQCIGAVLFVFGEIDAALNYYQEAFELAKQLKRPMLQADLLIETSEIYTLQGNYDEAIIHLQQALMLSMQTRVKEDDYRCHFLLAQNYKWQGNFELALLHYEQFHTIKETVFNEEENQKLKHLEVFHRTAQVKQQAEIYQLKYVQLEQEIAERKHIESVLRNTQKRECLGTMAAGIAHDFNNLLVGVMAQISLAKRKVSAESPAYRHLDKAENSAQRATELTQKILTYTGQRYTEFVLVDFNQFLEDNLAIFSIGIPKTIEISTTFAKVLPFISVDVAQIEQLIVNLMLNAAEAMANETGRIELSTGVLMLDSAESHQWECSDSVVESGQYVFFTVQDDGVGIPPEAIDKIFDPFFTTKFTGRGLGLAAVLGIVKSHQGGISVESQLQVGTTFRLLFPVVTQ